MKTVAFIVCIFFAQLCSCETLIEIYPPGEWELSDEDIIIFKNEIREYRDISTQTYDDFVNITTEFVNNAVVSGFIVDLMISWLPSRLNAYHCIMNATNVQNFFNEFGNPTEAHLEEIQNMLSKRVKPERLKRVMTFFNGFRYGATLDEVNAALMYFYGSDVFMNPTTTSVPMNNHNQTTPKPTRRN